MLSEAADGLLAANAPPWVLAAVRPLPFLIRTSAVGLRRRAGAGDPVSPEQLTPWRHELRGLASVVTGWSQIYRIARDDRTRGRASDTIERNAAALRALLVTPP